MNQTTLNIDFIEVVDGVKLLINEWEPKLLMLPPDVATNRKNSQGRTIRHIIGHMVDSASNNTHRAIHMQYQGSPLIFPNYASLGNNDRWIDIQDYQNENWNELVNLWKYTNLHFLHVVNNVDPSKLGNRWLAAENEYVSLKEMIIDFLRHFRLHINEIQELIS